MTASSGLTVGIDIGGTFIKCGLVRDGKLLSSDRLNTPSRSTPSVLTDLIVRQVGLLRSGTRSSLQGVGIGIPGLVEYPEGIVRSCVNLTGW